MGRFMTIARLLALMAAALSVSAATASAVTWRPQGTPVALTGTVTLTTNTGASVTCSESLTLTATGADAVGTPVWTSCTNTISAGLTTCVTSTTSVRKRATSTTTVTITSINRRIRLVSGTCASGSTICSMTESNVTITSNSFNNATNTMTYNSSVRYSLTQTGLCDGATSGSQSGTLRGPSPWQIA
jgi:hypothetical protein